MRAREFLIEYRRDVTAQAMGDKLLQTLAATKAFNVPDPLYNLHSVIDMATRPEVYPRSNLISLAIGGQPLSGVGIETAPQIVQQNKQKFIDLILAYIEAHDPTQNKSYTQWLARSWINSGGEAKLEDLNRNNLLVAYTRGKQRRLIKPEHADINRFKTYKEFEVALLQNYNTEELFGDEGKEQVQRGMADTVFKDKDVRVVVPHDQNAACYYGQGTQWCTAATRGQNYFNHYTRTGKLYILIPTQPKYVGEKYQIHFNSGSFMDEEDTPVVPTTLLFERFPTLYDFFIKEEPAIKEYVAFTDDATLNEISKLFSNAVEEFAYEMVGTWMDHDEYFSEWQAEQAVKLGYVDDDGDIDWDKVHEDERLTDYSSWNLEAEEFLDDAKTAGSISRDEARDLATEIYMEDGDLLKVTEFDRIVAMAIKKHFGRGDSDHGLAEYVTKHYGLVKGVEGNWVIKFYR